ncbi:MAG: RHS repeat-associated core domain-containing protein [Bacteroidota bacterium]
MANSDILEIPQIQPFQFSTDSKGIDNSVNLFRGDVNFYIPLVSLTGRNGLDLQVSALYRSNVDKQVQTRNLSAPTSILGLGWELPTDRIEVETNGTGNQYNTYFFVHNEIRSLLYRNTKLWLRGVLNKSYIGDLNSQNFSPALFAALLSEGLRIDATANIAVAVQGSSWEITDPVNEFVLKLELIGSDIQVYDGGNSYELQGYDYSRIRYYATFERWEITYTNGMTNVFGGNVTVTNQIKSSSHQAIQWGICMGNWQGASIVTHSSSDPTIRIQSQFARAWNFASSRTIWNDQVTFEYDQVTQPVGVDGLPYTKASYLKKITDVFGRTVVFTYKEKTYDTSSPQSPREYADPNKPIPNNDPDAFQSYYQTRYLDEIQVFNEKEDLLYELNFAYTLERYTSVPPNNSDLYGDTFKRTLITVAKKLGTGHSFPNIDLLYYDATSVHPGALKSITYVEGSTTTYAYSKKELVNCSRNLKIDNPVPGSTPRVWFGEDFSVVTWYSQGRLDFSIYTWIGRWQKWVPDINIINDFIDLDTFSCDIQRDSLVLYYKNANGQNYTARAFRKNSRILGSWLEYTANPIVVFSTDCQVTGGENYFAIADLINSKVNTYTWDALAGQWNEAALLGYTPPATPGSTMLFMSGINNIFMFLSYDTLGAPGQKNNDLTLYYIDDLCQWHMGDTRKASEIAIDQNNLDANFSWTPLPWAMTATYVTDSSLSTLSYSISIYQWGATNADNYKMKEPVTKTFSLQKSSPSGSVTIPYVANCTPLGLLSSGPNLMRYNGEQWLANNNLALQMQVLDNTLFWFTVGADFVIKTENSENRVLGMAQVFDPNTQTVQWQEQAITLFDSQPVGDRFTEYFPSSSYDYLTWNIDVYERGTSTNWVDSLKNPVYSIPLGTDTTTLINQGPNYMVYLLKGTDHKTILGTEVLTMTNGVVDAFAQLNERYFSLVNSDGSFVSDANGKMPGGLNSFLTYLPLDKDFNEASSITLYRFIGQAIESPIISYPATQVSIFDGFQTVETLYDFDVNSAVCDYQGAIAKFYQTTVSKNDPKINGCSVYTFFNSLNGTDFNTGNLTTSSFLDGTLYITSIYDASGKLVSSSQTDFQIITSVASNPGTNADTPIFGAIVQVTQSTQVQDGVENRTTYQYNPASGNVCSQQLSAYNALGELEVHNKKSIYGFEDYPSLWYLNNLSFIVQSKAIVNVNNQGEIVISCSATTVKAYAVPLPSANVLLLPDIFETYIWLGGNGLSDFDFAKWSSGTGYPADWLKTSSITIRSPHGLVLEKQAPMGKTQTELYNQDESALIASFSNASIQGQEAYYYGFEAYENPGAWSLDSNTPIVNTISYSGTQCLSIVPGKEGQALVLKPANQGRAYLFTFWAKPAANYNTNQPAGWNIALYNGNALSKEITIVLEAADQWQFYFQSINFADVSGNNLTVKISPFNKGNTQVFYDNVGFAPFENPFNVSVYESIYYHVTEELGPYNEALRRRYDSLGRIIGQTDHSEALVRMVAPFLSRQVNGIFNQAEPNSLVNFQPMGDTLLDRFYNNGVYTDNWSTSNPANWISQQGYLIYNASTAGAIQLSNPSFVENYALHVGFTADESINKNVGLTVGTDLTLQWLPNTRKWQLLDRKNNKTLDCTFESQKPEEDWVLVLSQAGVFFFVDSRLAFSYLPSKMLSGTFGLFTSNKVRFTNFFIGLSPQVAVKYLDGAGKDLQGQSLEGNKVTVTQTVYDAALQPAITTMPATLDAVTTALLAYRADAVTAIDWETGIMKGAIADKLPEDEGYPYSRKVFESSPLGRTIEIGAPGKDFAITGNQNSPTVQYTYASNTNAESGLPASQYFKTSRQDQNGNVGYALRDKFGSQINNTTSLKNGSNIQNASLISYANTGKTTTERLPNYYNPPQGSKPTDWQRLSFMNTRGQLTSFTEPNAGSTYFIYNVDGLVRFSQNAEQAGKGFVLYKKYDTENRIIEEGYFPYTWNQDDLQNKADNNPNWPGTSEAAMPQNKYYYNGDGTTLHDLGNLTQIEVMNKSNPGKVEVRTIQRFNNRQQLAQIEVTLLSDNVTFVTNNEYDNQGNIKSVLYPTGIKLTNIRDEVGRVAKIVDGNLNDLIEVTYTSGDQILTETNKVIAAAPVTTTYSYNSQGWLTKAQSPQLTETLTYINNGYEGSGYFDGSVASKTIQLSVPAGSQLPSELTYKYSYGETYQVKVAQCLLGGQVMCQWSLGLSTPVTYDDNGNFLQVDTEKYVYQAGTDFSINTNGTADKDFAKDNNGATIVASPRGITQILRDIYSGIPNSIETATNGTLNFVYDQKNNRVSKKVNDSTKYYARNSSGAVLTEKQINKGVTLMKDYLYGPTGMFGMTTPDGMNAIQKDHLKSPRVLIDSTGKVTSAYQYEPFGALINPADVNMELLQFLFGGYEWDAETGLYNAGARLYDPILKRFYSTDPKQQYASPYIFAGNNPINMVDPNGESSWWAMLIGAVVGTIVTIATGGAGAILLGTELAASMAVGAVAGTVGSLAGDATTAGIAGEKFTGKRALIDALSGFAGGFVGAGVGGAAGKGVMKLAYNAGRNTAADINFVTRLGTSTSMLTGSIAGATASAGVTSAMTGQAFFSKETAMNIAIGAVAGAGGALIAAGAHFGWFGVMPVEMGANDFNRIRPNIDIGNNNQKLLTIVSDADYTNTRQNIIADHGHEDAIFRMSPNGPEIADVVAIHGVGRFVFPYTNEGYTQPMSAKLFAQYLVNYHPYLDANVHPALAAVPLKLSICFSALPGRFGSVGQTLASALGRTTYAGRGAVYPSDLAQNWIQFN